MITYSCVFCLINKATLTDLSGQHCYLRLFSLHSDASMVTTQAMCSCFPINADHMAWLITAQIGGECNNSAASMNDATRYLGGIFHGYLSLIR